LTQSKSKIFTREATGLVRTAGLLDTLALNYGYSGSSFSVWIAFLFSSALFAFPGGDFGLAFIIAAVPTVLFVALPFAFLSITMPRSGGDYVYNSRLLHPSVGFAFNFTISMMLAFFCSFGAYWGAGLAVSTFLGVLGYDVGNNTLISWSVALQSTSNLFILSSIMVILFGLIVASGLKNYFRFNNTLFIIGTIGMIVGLVLLGNTSQLLFQEKFNTFMHLFTSDKNYYSTIISTASKSGWSNAPFSWFQTFLMVPIAASASIFIMGSAYTGGEVKQASRNQLLSMPLAVVILTIETVVLYWLDIRAVGLPFQSAVNYLWLTSPSSLSLPLWPFFNLWMTISTSNITLAIVAGIGFLALGLQYPPMNLMVITRTIFAWSFDRIFPEKFSHVNDRTHSPLWAILFGVVVAEGFLVLFVYTPYFTGLAAIAASSTAVLLACASASILPYKMRSVYESSPISKYKIGNIPLVTALGSGGIVFIGYLLISYLTNPAYAANSPSSLAIIAATIIVGLMIYFAAYGFRKRRGIDIRLAFNQIPPE
jgi:APA family basic amino acid/polyamine antiporter